MGFSTRKLYKLVFAEDSDLHGLEITVRTATLGERRAYVAKQPQTKDLFESLEYQGRHFLSYVVEWNLEDPNGEPVPKTWEDFEATIPLEWVTPIIQAYTAVALGQKADPTTEKKSGSGERTETTHRTEESLPMEPLP